MSLRRVYASSETEALAKKSSNKKVEVYSFFPVDRADCLCQPMLRDWKNNLAKATQSDQHSMMEETPYLVCPRDKTGMNRYEITCNKCKEILGYCWATDPSLSDWCDFHYVQWTDGDYWRGCLTPHISPITEQLCFECCCGEDTRDFRANMTLNQKTAEAIEEENQKGRDLNTKDSKFKARQVDENVII